MSRLVREAKPFVTIASTRATAISTTARANEFFSIVS
jgi:hypothetical protein